MMLPQLVNILMLCLLLSVSMSDALPAVNNNSTSMNISANASLGSSESVSSTEIKGHMIHYGFLGIATTWDDAYAVSNHEQYAGWTFSTHEKVPIGTQISFFAYVGKQLFTDIPIYIKITLRVMQPRDGDFTATTMEFMNVSMDGAIKLEASYNVELIESCTYGLIIGVGQDLKVKAGDKELVKTTLSTLNACTGNRPPRK